MAKERVAVKLFQNRSSDWGSKPPYLLSLGRSTFFSQWLGLRVQDHLKYSSSILNTWTASGLRVHGRVLVQFCAGASFETGWGPAVQVEPQAFLAAIWCLVIPFCLQRLGHIMPDGLGWATITPTWVHGEPLRMHESQCWMTASFMDSSSTIITMIPNYLTRTRPVYVNLLRKRESYFLHSVSTWSTCSAHQKRPKSDVTYTFIRCYRSIKY